MAAITIRCNWNSILPTSTIMITINWIGHFSRKNLILTNNDENSKQFSSPWQLCQQRNGRQKSDKKRTMNARTAGRMYHTRFVFIFCETCCNIVCVCLCMPKNVFIWIKHWTHRWFEQIRIPNFQNYQPNFSSSVSDAPWQDNVFN